MKLLLTTITLVLFLLYTFSVAGESPQTLTAYLGSAPTVDGIISNGEYADAEQFIGVKEWKSDTKTPSQDSADLSVTAWVKHDGAGLYFAFDVMDDVIYGFDIDRWVHSNNPTANEMNYQNGWSWWGDGVEIMMNSTYKWNDNETCAGDGKSWQVVCSTHKSTLGGLGVGGLMAGEPRNAASWGHYESWTKNGDMRVAVRLKDKNEGRGYVIEWRINPNPCMQINSSTFVDLSRETKVGINFEIQDLDEKEKGNGNWSNMHHIDYWAKVGSHSKTALKSFGTLIIKPEKMETTVGDSKPQPADFYLSQNYPNPFNPSTTITYGVPAAVQNVHIHVYDITGKLIRTLFQGQQRPGSHEIMWDGLDARHNSVAGGVYFVRMNTDKKATHVTRKVTLLK